MGKHTQLELIRDLAQSREHELATEVGELQRLKSSAEVALNRLDTYLSEYTASATSDGLGTGRQVTQVENERRFVKRLSLAVEQQRVRTRQFSDRVNSKLQTWQRERAQLMALERAVTQRRQLSGQLQARREQTESDAVTGRRMALKNRS